MPKTNHEQVHKVNGSCLRSALIVRVPEDVMSSPANDEAGQEALGNGLQDSSRNHVDS